MPPWTKTGSPISAILRLSGSPGYLTMSAELRLCQIGNVEPERKRQGPLC